MCVFADKGLRKKTARFGLEKWLATLLLSPWREVMWVTTVLTLSHSGTYGASCYIIRYSHLKLATLYVARTSNPGESLSDTNWYLMHPAESWGALSRRRHLTPRVWEQRRIWYIKYTQEPKNALLIILQAKTNAILVTIQWSIWQIVLSYCTVIISGKLLKYSKQN